MDKLKSLRPGASKPSYDGASESRSSKPSRFSRENLHRPSLDSVKGFIKTKTGVGSSPAEESSGARPITALRDPKSFAPPPKRDPHAPVPPLPVRRTTSSSDGNPPPVPPRLPPRRDGSFPVPREVGDEEMRSTGGVNVGALDRLGRAGVSVPGFEPVGRGTTMPPPPPRPSTLGDRLGGMALNSNSQPPSQGTTMEEKKAAAITANKFYKDPSSVSFKDARAAAGTARNFQQRHGDQVASGMKTANRLGLSAGILPPPTQREGPPSPPVRSAGPLPPVLGKRPPPPPPPKKKPALPTKGTPPPVPVSNRPPPVPMSSRPPPLSARPPPISPRPSACSTTPTALSNSGIPESEAPSMPLDLDLALPTQWYTHTPPRFPPCISTNSKKSMTYTTSWSTASSGRKTHTLTVAIRWTLNLSLTRLRITWDASAPAVTARASQRHFPPPQPPALNSLPLVGSAVARWCEARLGQCVGNGECWTLASEALKATPGAMASQGYTHGACVYTHTAPAAAVSAGEIQVGDVLQFWKARWEWGNGAWKSAGDPDHTAVVTGVRVKDAGAGGGPEVEVVEQNVGGVKTVVRGTYELGEGKMVQGRCRVFRAVGEDWAPLEATWDD